MRDRPDLPAGGQIPSAVVDTRVEVQRDGWKAWTLMVVLALIWDSTFILIKRGLFHEGRPVLSPVQAASCRLVIAWLALTPFLFRHMHHIWKHRVALLFSGLVGNAIPAFLFATAQSRIDSSLAGMLNSLTPLFAMVLGAAFFHTRMRGIHIVGVLLGLLGAVGLMASRGDGGPINLQWAALLVVLATVCYGLSVNIIKRYLHEVPPVGIAAMALTFIGPPSLLVAWWSGVPATLATDPQGWSALGYVALLAVLSSALALVLWNVLLQRTTAVWASSVTYLMPLVAIGWGALDGEVVRGVQFAMMGAILAGLLLINLADRRVG